ncbi:prolipoprotein diacylglyceryl transferase [Isoptericola sp. CG 20/1183]|uniref:Phosphatidylglycerol--prolipoprotein diacylglyceryl transferase n=1 Tax=Isoptericola halotolerans TaxID=300560 RepID=A0ABX5EAA7_9MICO|nr:MULTISPECIES: prolipoprotein diacylglyceryl transferase [Isoptericola]PRZ03453.1 prolipoprotein diacylglyceryl transferase [Isoptericola sp. CG 20/1183]PRZ03740.1 prolipoprotein diacylglyceryl transferase [Isoptericola halotolerans]
MTVLGQLAASIPSPDQHTWHLGPVPIRAYALAILAGIVVAVWMTMRRWKARGGDPDDVLEIAFWAVPFGIVGGRIYHVVSTPDPYWGENGDPVSALYIWEGGLGIWGAVALGAVGAWIGCRRLGVRLSTFADALAPGLLVAQAIGRLGNWFNQELFGAPTELPWGLEIDVAYLPVDPATGLQYAEGTLFHPTFLYEMLWNLAAAALLIWLDRRYRLGHGRVFWAYVVIYTLGRVWIEMLRIDTAEMVLGMRLNVWTSLVVGLGALVAFVVVGRLHPGREDGVSLPGSTVEPDADAQTETDGDHAGTAQAVADEDTTDTTDTEASAAGPDQDPAPRA